MYGYNRCTNTLAIHLYQIDVTEIGRKLEGSLVDLCYLGIADK